MEAVNGIIISSGQGRYPVIINRGPEVIHGRDRANRGGRLPGGAQR